MKCLIGKNVRCIHNVNGDCRCREQTDIVCTCYREVVDFPAGERRKNGKYAQVVKEYFGECFKTVEWERG